MVGMACLDHDAGLPRHDVDEGGVDDLHPVLHTQVRLPRLTVSDLRLRRRVDVVGVVVPFQLEVVFFASAVDAAQRLRHRRIKIGHDGSLLLRLQLRQNRLDCALLVVVLLKRRRLQLRQRLQTRCAGLHNRRVGVLRHQGVQVVHGLHEMRAERMGCDRFCCS
jgi:hypothetical protein